MFRLIVVCLQQMKQLKLLDVARTTKAQPRTVVLTRATREEYLHFNILGGTERGCGLFINKVEKGSKADIAGLKRGDQVSCRVFSMLILVLSTTNTHTPF